MNETIGVTRRFCPSVFLYLSSVVPSIWLLEFDKLDKRLELRDSSFNFTMDAINLTADNINITEELKAIQTFGVSAAASTQRFLSMRLIDERSFVILTTRHSIYVWIYIGRNEALFSIKSQIHKVHSPGSLRGLSLTASLWIRAWPCFSTIQFHSSSSNLNFCALFKLVGRD